MRISRSLLFLLAAASLALAPTAAFARTKKAHHPKSTSKPAHHHKVHGKAHRNLPASAARPSNASLSLEPSTAAAPATGTPGLRAAPTRPKKDF